MVCVDKKILCVFKKNSSFDVPFHWRNKNPNGFLWPLDSEKTSALDITHTKKHSRTIGHMYFQRNTKFNNNHSVRSMTFTEKNSLIYPIKCEQNVILVNWKLLILRTPRSVSFTRAQWFKDPTKCGLCCIFGRTRRWWWWTLNKCGIVKATNSVVLLFSFEKANVHFVCISVNHIHSRSNTLSDVNYAWYALYQFISNLCVRMRVVFYHLNSWVCVCRICLVIIFSSFCKMDTEDMCVCVRVWIEASSEPIPSSSIFCVPQSIRLGSKEIHYVNFVDS